jgi:K+-sensing histidine kinase KdpD
VVQEQRSQGAIAYRRPMHTLQECNVGPGIALQEDHAIGSHGDVPADHLRLRMDAQDIVEQAGNLVDNAAIWAREHAMMRVQSGANEIVLTIDDDGPGVPPELIASLGERGVRLDESRPSTGLGLAISRDLVAAYGGCLTLSNRAEGGLRAEVRLPPSLLVRDHENG